MARISRVVASGFPHHVTQRACDPFLFFQTDSEGIYYLEFMAEELSLLGVDVLAWCLMANHVMEIGIVSPEFWRIYRSVVETVSKIFSRSSFPRERESMRFER